MRMFTFAKRCTREILRDPLNLFFGLGFPLVLLLLLSAIQANVPVSLFEIESLAPGITVFGLAFISLFSATLIARDRESAFLQRLYTTPLTAADYILGYMLPLVPIAVAQSGICYLAAFALGMKATVNVVYAILLTVPISVLYIAIGLLCGSACNVKQVGGLCGALLTNVSAWLSGIWFDLALVGGAFQTVAYVFPFVHAVNLQRSVIAGSADGIAGHFAVIALYDAVILASAILVFLKQMKDQ